VGGIKIAEQRALRYADRSAEVQAKEVLFKIAGEEKV
jgi:hypothetical protein